MKKLLILVFIAVFCTALSAGYIFDGKIIFTSHATNKDSLAYLIIEKAGGVLDTIAEFDTTGYAYWYVPIWIISGSDTLKLPANLDLADSADVAGWNFANYGYNGTWTGTNDFDDDTKIDTLLIPILTTGKTAPAGYATQFIDTVGTDSIIWILDDGTRRGHAIE